jgi:hypothetical protein
MEWRWETGREMEWGWGWKMGWQWGREWGKERVWVGGWE